MQDGTRELFALRTFQTHNNEMNQALKGLVERKNKIEEGLKISSE
jgi:hypothetical protein